MAEWLTRELVIQKAVAYMRYLEETETTQEGLPLTHAVALAQMGIDPDQFEQDYQNGKYNGDYDHE